MHQFTYESLLKRDRRAYHALAASWLATLASERGVEYLAATGEHHERAGQFAQAVSYTKYTPARPRWTMSAGPWRLSTRKSMRGDGG